MTTSNNWNRLIDHSNNPYAVPCPACGTKMAPKIHGFPGLELMEASRKGWVGLGGCMPPLVMSAEDIRARHCAECGPRLAALLEYREKLSDAQSGGWYDDVPTFEVALSELVAGKKTSHWIWYIFPQILLGSSEMARKYAVPSRDIVLAVLDDSTFGARYKLAVDAVAAHVLDNRGDKPAWEALVDLMGSRLDAKKFVSSITLFGEISRIAGVHLDVAERLDRFVAAGLRPCSSTLDAIVAGEV